MTRRAILIHGVASSTADTWERTGWPELLDEIGIGATPVELPGHGGSRLPPDADAESAVAEVLAADPDADVLLGFSAGASLALWAAASAPERFGAVVLLGLGDGMWGEPASRAAAAERLLGDDPDPGARLLRSMARAAGNDLERVAAYIAHHPGPPPLDRLGAITADVLIVIGEDDPVAPADRVSTEIPRCRVVTLPRTDHYRTPGEPATMAAVLGFLEAS